MLKRYSAVAACLLLLGTVSLVGCESTGSSAGQVPAQAQSVENTAIIKSPNDDRQYSAVMLANGLQAVLVTDPASEVAAVSLAVGVGSYQDPDSQLGLSHYLEHMLFLGTEKYPEPNSFQKFVDGNAGVWNAYTARDHTNYFFQLKADQLDKALDFFSDYFRAPTFDPQYSDKERNAVNSEWSMGRTNDNWIMYRISGLTSNPAHPAHRFTTGNLETLSDKPGSLLQDELRAFYNRYYSANNMKLTIVGNQSQAELKALAEKHFSSIPNKNIERPQVKVPGLTRAQEGQHIHVKTLKDLKQLFIEFPIADNSDLWPVKPNGYLHYLISSEEPGTLGEQLRREGLANSVSASVSADEYGMDGTFSVYADLTEKGLRNKDHIISSIFAYIELMKAKGVDERYYREIKAMWEKDFANAEKQQPLQQATELSYKQFDYPVANLLNSDFVYERFDAKAIKTVLKQLTPARARIWHVSNNEVTDQPVPYYEGSYAVKKFSAAELKAWANSGKKMQFQLPPENDLFTDKPAPIVAATHSKPQKLVEQQGVEAWLVHTQHFQEDKGFVELNLNIDFAYNGIEQLVAANLLADIYKMHQTSLVDRAGRAGISIGLDLTAEKGQAFSIYGYTEKQAGLVQTLLQDYVALTVSDEDLAKAKDRFVKTIANNKKEIPIRQAFNRFGLLTRAKGNWDDAEVIAAAEKITLAQVQAHHKAVLANHLLRVYAAGNFTDGSITALATAAAHTLGSNKAPAQRYFAQSITPKTGGLISDNLDIDPTDNALVDIYLGTQKNLTQQAQLMLLNGLFSTDIFTQLRTNEQLGYVVGSTGSALNDYPLFGLYVQTTNTSLVDLKARMDKFRKDYLATLQALEPAQLEQLKAAEIAQIMQKPNDYRAEATQHLQDFKEGKFSFDRKERVVAALQQVTKADLIKIYQQLVLGKQGHNVVIQARGANYKNQPFAPLK
ncbi:insulinase family protein [Cellvibrio sp. QJXJ]|uniref:insulinase family protein n=1 Tax=Cellvibrio sp. QJXJ TaxID=2964606 RepID=UPI0021C2981D|nr:insulinase family protein [Cellvibrio sp. QJXJ]UUA72193.1 insulinase family protein [Cellvibrio sp. QJXJ]